MKPEIKKLWVDALRSGKYKQGTHRLRDGNKFCCLGVLCEISGKGYNPEDGGLPANVMRWAGLDTNTPSVPLDGRNRQLYYINDNLKGYGFKRIANLIEKYL